MGRRGPPPTPTPILRARGSHRANERKGEPEPIRERPRCPSWLTGEARRAFRQLVPMMEAMGVLSKSDVNAIARYCDIFARWRETTTWIDDNGSSYPVRKVNPKTGELYAVGVKLYPQVDLANRYATQLLRLEREFGLTPSARARIATGDLSDKPKEEEDTGGGAILRLAT